MLQVKRRAFTYDRPRVLRAAGDVPHARRMQAAGVDVEKDNDDADHENDDADGDDDDYYHE